MRKLLVFCAVTVVFATPALALQAGSAPPPTCQQQQTNHTIAGAAIGAALGAVVGNNVSASHHHSDGTIVGAATGGVAGGVIGHNTTQCAPDGTLTSDAQPTPEPYDASKSGGSDQPPADSNMPPPTDDGKGGK